MENVIQFSINEKQVNNFHRWKGLKMARRSGRGNTPDKVIVILKDAVDKSSQLAVSKILGIGVASVNRYINGIGEPTQETLEKLADYFGTSVTWLRSTSDLSFKETTDILSGRGLGVPIRKSYEILEGVRKALDLRGIKLPDPGSPDREKYISILKQHTTEECTYFMVQNATFGLVEGALIESWREEGYDIDQASKSINDGLIYPQSLALAYGYKLLRLAKNYTDIDYFNSQLKLLALSAKKDTENLNNAAEMPDLSCFEDVEKKKKVNPKG